MKQKLFLPLMLMALFCLQTSLAQVHYRFLPTDYSSTDNNRAPQSAFVYNDNAFTVNASGQNNIAFKMGGECDGKYFINNDDQWFIVEGSPLKTGTADAYLWWLNGTNYGTQVAPDHVATIDNKQLFVWNLKNGNDLFSWFNTTEDRIVLNSKGTGFILAMGLTSNGTSATISNIGYYSEMSIATHYQALMPVLGITHEALAQKMRTALTEVITAAQQLLNERPATAQVKNALRTAINHAQATLESINTENYISVPEEINSLKEAMETYKAQSREVGYEITNDGLLAHWDNINIRLHFMNDSTLRVTKFIGNESKVEQSLVITALQAQTIAIDHNQDNGVVTLSTGKMRLTYNVAEALVTVYRSNGEMLISEKMADITEKADGPNDAYLLKQVFALDADEQIYGMGQLQNGRLSMRGLNTTMIQDNRSIYIPYYYSSKRYALYWDNYSPTTFTDNEEGTTFSSTGQAIDYYVLTGNSANDVLNSWRVMTGGTQLPPLWNFGLYQSKQRYQSTQEVIDVVAKYRQQGVPLDCVVQDWQYWGDDNHWNAMDFLNPKYSDYQRMIDEVHAMNAKIMISVWPDFGPQTNQYKEFGDAGRLIPIQSYPTSVATRPYDVYSETTRKRYWNYMFNGLMSKGIDALWLDSAEPDDFSNKTTDYDYVTGFNGRTFRSLRNAFPLCHVEGVYDNHRAESSLANKRVSILTRSAFAGMQRTGAFVWSADITSSWQTLAAQIPAACNLSVSGLPYWNSDTGAFFIGSYGGVGDANWRALYNRWTQFSCFCPMMRFHGDQTPREIWQFGEKNDAQGDYNNILRYIRLRYRLLPYIYSTAHQVVDNNETFMMAMPIAFENDAKCVNVIDQYMLGHSFLVAPVVTEGAAGRNVYLPNNGSWYDFWTGNIYKGGKTIFRSTPQDIMPLYIPAGTILPIGPEVQYSTEKKWDDIEIRVYPGANGQFTLYEDEFDGYGYQQGAKSEIPFTWDEATHTLTIGDRTGNYPGMLNERVFRIVRVSSKKGFGDKPSENYNEVINYNGTAINVHLAELAEVEPMTEDMTNHIVNPSFEADGKTLNKVAPQGWTVESNTTWWGVNNGGGNGDPQATDGNFIFGVWDGSATMTPTISQVIPNLPQGKYLLTVDMMASNRSATTIRLGKQHVFAGTNKGYFADQMSTAGMGDTYPMQTISVAFDQREENTPVTIGVATEGAQSETWFKIDNFRLYKVGEYEETVGIDSRNVMGMQVKDAGFFDLFGRKASLPLKKGIYFRNNKKVIVKD